MLEGQKGSYTKGLIGIVIMLGCLFATNSWYDFQDPMTIISSDTTDYMVIFDAYPHLPNGEKKIVNEGAHRFIVPYLIGFVHHATGVPPLVAYQTFAVVLAFLITFSFNRILIFLNISDKLRLICLAMFVFNPYCLRYTLAFPAMSADLLFVLGLTILLHGVLKANSKIVLLAALVMILGRQTAAVTIPALWIFLFADRSWSKKPLASRLALGIAYSTIIFGIFRLQIMLSLPFSTRPALGGNFLFGFWDWAIHSFNSMELLAFLTRGVVAVLIPLALVAIFWQGVKVVSREFLICTLIYLAVMIQPYLAGPTITGGNVQRLSLLGLIPLLTAVAVYLPKLAFETMSRWHLFAVLGLLFAGSLHHTLSLPASRVFSSNMQFGVFYLVILIVFGLSLVPVRKSLRTSKALEYR